jgi:hypothetical protein
MTTVIPGVMFNAVVNQFPDGHLDCHWQEPSKQRDDKWPKHIRRESWLIQNKVTGLYYSIGPKPWVAQPEAAFSCLWFGRAVEMVRSVPDFFGSVENLQMVQLTFYCDPETFPNGWFCNE